MKDVGIIDYKSGNIESLKNSLNYLHFNPILIKNKKDLINLSHVILPGVGAFKECINELKKNEALEDILNLVTNKKISILGICVGMQMLFESSSEFEDTEGLKILKGKITRIKSTLNYKIPHVGWNNIIFTKSFGSFNASDEEDFYFDHSYAFKDLESEDILTTSNHSEKFVAAVKNQNIVGVQFHPEKSQKSGLKFLQSFLELKC